MATRRVSPVADAEPAAEEHPERISESRTRTIGRGQMAATVSIRALKSLIPTTGARSVPDRDPPKERRMVDPGATRCRHRASIYPIRPRALGRPGMRAPPDPVRVLRGE